jgi:hypothetical protein
MPLWVRLQPDSEETVWLKPDSQPELSSHAPGYCAPKVSLNR